MYLVLMLLKVIHLGLRVPQRYMWIFVLATIFFLSYHVIRCVYRCVHKPWFLKILSFLFAIYLILGVCKLIPYMDGARKTQVPKLVATMEAKEIKQHLILTYYSFKSGPFTIDPVYHRNKSFSSANELEWVVANTQDTDRYTYIISFGSEISEVSYDIWTGYDCLPVPWNGAVMYPEFNVTSENDCTIYIYRIDKVLIEAGL